MKHFLSLVCSTLVLFLIYLALAPQTVHAGLPNGSPCITVPANLMSSTCSSGFCKSLTQNLPGLPGICMNWSCTCDNPGINGDGKNGWKCTDGSTNACKHREEACIKDDSSPGHVRCQNDISCTCSADQRQVQCHSNANGGEDQNFTCDPDKVCLIGTNFQHEVFNQTVVGADCQKNCSCTNPGKTGDPVNGVSQNGWTCADGSKGACNHREEACIKDGSAPGGVRCQTDITCKCSSDLKTVECHSPTSGSADFYCGKAKICVTGANQKHTVFNQDVYGADCQVAVIPTSEPPCAPGAIVDGKCTAVVTALGNVQTDPAGFITKLFGVLLAAAGAIALILIMRAGYRIMTARGNPEGIKEGREQIVAAIIGLMFLIFSFVLLQVIGVDLLKLPT